jgi:ABC-type glutathione transport system ATPase component
MEDTNTYKIDCSFTEDIIQKILDDERPLFSKMEQHSCYSQIKQQLLDEGRFSASVRQSFAQSLDSTEQDDFKEGLKRFRNSLQTFDIPNFTKLVNVSEKAVMKVGDEDLFLLIGDSGSGKSTTIHYLAGSTMKKTEVDGVPHVDV